jgi:hypothetical protein
MQFRSSVFPGSLSSMPRENAVSSHPLEMREAVDEKEKEGELRVIEFDFSRAPQPFLDGEAILAKMRAARDGWKGDEMK